MILRSPSVLPWRCVIVDRLDMDNGDRGRLHAGRRSWKLRPHLLAGPGEGVHDAYVDGVQTLMTGMEVHGIARIKTRWGRVIGIGHGVPHVDTHEIPILQALGVDMDALGRHAVDRMDWNSWMDPPGDPHPHARMSRMGRVSVRLGIGEGVTYSDGAITVPRLPETVVMGIAGLRLASLIQDDRLDPLGLVIRRVESSAGGTTLHLLDAVPHDVADSRLRILDAQAAAIVAGRKGVPSAPERIRDQGPA